MEYQKADGSTIERLVYPLGLVTKGSVWYLVAWAKSGGAFVPGLARAGGLCDGGAVRPASGL